MDISGGIQASLAGRYAIALFELAREEKKLDAVAASLGGVRRRSPNGWNSARSRRAR